MAPSTFSVERWLAINSDIASLSLHIIVMSVNPFYKAINMNPK